MGTGANAWKYLFGLINEGYEIKLSECCLGTNSIEIEIKKDIHHARYAITQKSLEVNMLGDNLLMFEILKKLRGMVGEQAKKGEEK